MGKRDRDAQKGTNPFLTRSGTSIYPNEICVYTGWLDNMVLVSIKVTDDDDLLLFRPNKSLVPPTREKNKIFAVFFKRVRYRFVIVLLLTPPRTTIIITSLVEE